MANRRVPYESALIGILFTTLILMVYFPGLSGDFQFDDYNVIVLNPVLTLETVSLSALLEAAFSTNTGPLARPLAMLSFAFNQTAFGPAPWSFKLTNVVIHLTNALLLWLVLQRLALQVTSLTDGRRYLPAMVALIWAVHPANLSAVLYIVQRMTLLSMSFVLLGMLIYVTLRSRQATGRALSGWHWASLPIVLLLGVLCKESAVLLLPWLLVIECFVFQTAGWPQFTRDRRIWAAVAVVCLIILVCLWPWLMADYRGRNFTLVERLLTESRIVLLYARMVLVPDLSQFALFHDDVVLSTGLMTPVTTLPSLLVVVLAMIIVGLRKPRFFAFGVAWFGCGHLLESTVVPLELMHEHRNYLASAGLILALAAVFGGLAARLSNRLVGLLPLLLVLVLSAWMTRTRAGEWADEWLQLAREAHDHPNSARSQYEYGRLSIKRGGELGSDELVRRGIAALERSTTLRPNPLAHLPYAAVTKLALNSGSPEAYELWISRVIAVPSFRIRAKVFVEIVQCQIGEKCRAEADHILALADSVLSAPDITGYWRRRTLEWLSVFYFKILDDRPAAIELLRNMLAERPHDIPRELRLAEMLDADGQAAEARAIVERVRSRLPATFAFTDGQMFRRIEHLLDVIRPGASPPSAVTEPLLQSPSS